MFPHTLKILSELQLLQLTRKFIVYFLDAGCLLVKVFWLFLMNVIFIFHFLLPFNFTSVMQLGVDDM